MRCHLKHTVLGLIFALTLSTGGCGGPAQEACEDYKAAFQAFYFDKCEPYLAAALAQALEEAVDCSQALKVRDEQALYEDCFPTLEQLACDPLQLIFPASCEQQFYFEAPQVF